MSWWFDRLFSHYYCDVVPIDDNDLGTSSNESDPEKVVSTNQSQSQFQSQSQSQSQSIEPRPVEVEELQPPESIPVTSIRDAHRSTEYGRFQREDDEEQRSIVAIQNQIKVDVAETEYVPYCRPSKLERLERELRQAHSTKSKSDILLRSLKSMNVSIYVISYNSTDILKQIRQLIYQLSHHRNKTSNHYQHYCLLYKDHHGRLMNLLIAPHAIAPIHTFNYIHTAFSSTQALMALVLLSRSFPCLLHHQPPSFRPAYMSFILAFVLYEEIAYAWFHAQMFVRSLPSLAGYSLTTWVGNDWLRKTLLLLLTISGAATNYPETQTYMTLSGVILACSLLLSNLGSRTWARLSWNPPKYRGVGDDLLAFVFSIITGLFLPHLANPICASKNSATAFQAILVSATLVLITFFATSIDQVQEFVVVGSGSCPQQNVNIIVSIWWSISLLLCMLFVTINYHSPTTRVTECHEHDDSLLVFTHASPVGTRVPNLPDHFIDPHNLIPKPSMPNLFSVELQLLLLGAFMAMGVIGWVIYFTFFVASDGGFLGDITS